MVKTFIGGVSCVGKDEIIKPLIPKIKKEGIKYFHFGNEMKKFLPENISHLSGEYIKEYRNQTIEKMLSYDNIIVNGHYLVFLNKNNENKRKTINFRNKLKNFEKYILITAEFNEIKKRLKKRDKIIKSTHLIQIEMMQVTEEFEKYKKNKEGFLIYNQNKKLKENQRELENIIFPKIIV